LIVPTAFAAIAFGSAQQGVFFDNAYVDPEQVFSYDAIYRLIEAEGRAARAVSARAAAG